ncbi:MAG: hypothetical protein Q8M07_26245, partial [Prosthecobacter sp.]|nr:hypothetical protein [Prosthecobacter sp.]
MLAAEGMNGVRQGSIMRPMVVLSFKVVDDGEKSGARSSTNKLPYACPLSIMRHLPMEMLQKNLAH